MLFYCFYIKIIIIGYNLFYLNNIQFKEGVDYYPETTSPQLMKRY
jgi:hypothetical protein